MNKKFFVNLIVVTLLSFAFSVIVTANASSTLPTIKSLNSKSGASGKKIRIKGNNFQDTPGKVIITKKENEYDAEVKFWSNALIIAKLPWGIYPPGKCKIFIADYQDIRTQKGKIFFYKKAKPHIGKISPQNIKIDDSITISGNNFGPDGQEGSLVVKGGALSVISWTESVITATAVSIESDKLKIRVKNIYDKSNLKSVKALQDKRDYREDMRNFVEGISSYAKNSDSDFFIIPQNGPELLTLDGEEDGPEAEDYISSIDGVGREDLFYGYRKDNKATPKSEQKYLTSFMDLAVNNGIKIMVTDYCRSHPKMDKSYSKNEAKNYISFAANHRELDNIPSYPAKPYNENSSGILDLNDAKNFLYLINPEQFSTKQEFLNTLKQTNYDVILIDLFFNDAALSLSDISSLKLKANGAQRIVICYMSIGEAEDYRYYWQNDWKNNPPSWLAGENPHWKGNFKVRYWDQNWQDIIYGNSSAYLDKILASGFDGVYLDIIDAFEYFE